MARLAGDAACDSEQPPAFSSLLLGLIQCMGRWLTGPLRLMLIKEKGSRNQDTTGKHRQYDIGD
ncbi:hypothetical protein [Rhizobium sp. 11515TR]|uniref:hypothetical protein n=1 Tax=Rhizobium sp. 11515TR TaxID=2028343 RepID=UPI000BA8432B|nr:hypothetical protein [Rhizobium sp. 11515TR]ASW09665.1 hypothetical protein CKA34_26855 [Rhizobium sp. 11515TR]